MVSSRLGAKKTVETDAGRKRYSGFPEPSVPTRMMLSGVAVCSACGGGRGNPSTLDGRSVRSLRSGTFARSK